MTSEVFVIAVRRADDVPANARPWLLGVARKVMANHLRSRRRRAALETRLNVQRAQDDVNDVAWVESLDTLRRAIARLGRRDQEVITMLAAADLTNVELAAALGCSPGSASVRVHRARRRLRESLEAETAPETAPEAARPESVTPEESRT